jgi:uncharacterized protein with NRDE domain
MCLIFVSFQQHPDFPLIVAANRDEFYGRPSTAIHQWQDNTDIIAGRDIEKGGTWLGISRKARFAAVTNFRNGQRPENKKSRGELVLKLLCAEQPETFIDKELAETASLYNDFNCRYYNQQKLYYFSNKNKDMVTTLQPGIYGLSNALLDTPWPKVTGGKTDFSKALEKGPDEEALWKVLAENQPAADQDLPNTGVSLEWERILSPRFIRSQDYGTRSSTLVFWSRNGKVNLKERRYSTSGFLDQKNMIIRIH